MSNGVSLKCSYSEEGLKVIGECFCASEFSCECSYRFLTEKKLDHRIDD